MAVLRWNPDLKTLARIARAFRPYRWQVAMVLATVVGTAALGLVPPLLIRSIFDQAIGRRDFHRLALDCALLFGVPVIVNVISSGQTFLNLRVGQAVMRDFRLRLFTHLQRMSLRFYTSTPAGEIQSRLTNDVNGVQGLVTNTAPNFVANFTTVVSAVVAMGVISPPLTLLSLALMPVFLLITVRAGRLYRRTNERRQRALASLSNVVYETLSISGILLMKTFGREERAAHNFGRENENLLAIEIEQQRVGRWSSLSFGTIFAAIPAGVYLLAGWQMIRGTAWLGAPMTAGTLVAFTALQGRFFSPAAQLLNLFADVQGGLALFDRIFEYLDLPVEIADRPGARRLDPAAVRGEIGLRGVSFAYQPGDTGKFIEQAGRRIPRHALSEVTFTVAPGEMAALVGPSGAGKTTIAYLVPRLYDADQGAVTIDGHDVRDLQLSSLAEIISVVTQETYLLHASLRDNLLYGRIQATDAEMVAAAKEAAIHNRIMELEQGYETVVGERGYKLSGGEKQRIAIARALLKNPRILILDEATSALDPVTERLIQQALDRLMRGRTTLVIAHRLSTVEAADQILVVEQGRIVERGRHGDLIAQGGAYARMHQRQLAE